jgi:hypothetical protein
VSAPQNRWPNPGASRPAGRQVASGGRRLPLIAILSRVWVSVLPVLVVDRHSLRDGRRQASADHPHRDGMDLRPRLQW